MPIIFLPNTFSLCKICTVQGSHVCSFCTVYFLFLLMTVQFLHS
nr:MAG TPA: hypothetical protein [Bacteriophage sp.]